MKKLILFLLFPFIIKAQTPAETKLKKEKIVFSEASKKEAKQLIESYRQQVINGEKKMSTMARIYSEDPGSAKDGGLIENVGKGMMVPEFEKIAFSLKVGEISEVFETQYGFHFIELVAKKGEFLDLRHILIIPKNK
ncbi:MAG: peptidylprolyl isomerase [Bacteroidota bacterium]|nr:peptidylprolyl isomerase [Bacteroidota bacterium]